MKFTQAIGLLFILVGCSTLQEVVSPTNIKSEINVISYPTGATVYAFSVKQNKYIELGKTPLVYGTKEIFSETQVSSLKLLVAKNGFVKEHIVINSDKNTNHKIKVNLEDAYNWSKKNSRVTSSVISGSWESLQKVNRLIRKRKYSKSLFLINELIADYKYAPILYDIKGSILTLQNKK